jgi:hypothetical protein
MKKNKTKIIKLVIATVTLCFITNTIPVVLGEYQQPPPQWDPTLEVLWYESYYDNAPALRIAADQDNSVYVCGGGYYDSGTVIKYNSTGDRKWVSNPTDLAESIAISRYISEPNGVPGRGALTVAETLQFIYGTSDVNDIDNIWDVACDNNDGVFACGCKGNLDPEISIISYIVKLDADTGEEIWNTSFLGISILNAITVDSNGYVYAVGCTITFSGDQLLTTQGLNIKLNPSGCLCWIKADGMSGPVMLYDVAADNQNHIYTAGIIFTDDELSAGGTFLRERCTIFGTIVNTYSTTTDDTLIYTIVLDLPNSALYTVGMGLSAHTGIIGKYTLSLSKSYSYATADNGFIGGRLFGPSFLIVTSENSEDQYTIAIMSKANGHLLKGFCIGEEHGNGFSAQDLVVDSDDNVIVSGGQSQMDTIKCQITGAW